MEEGVASQREGGVLVSAPHINICSNTRAAAQQPHDNHHHLPKNTYFEHGTKMKSEFSSRWRAHHSSRRTASRDVHKHRRSVSRPISKSVETRDKYIGGEGEGEGNKHRTCVSGSDTKDTPGFVREPSSSKAWQTSGEGWQWRMTLRKRKKRKTGSR